MDKDLYTILNEEQMAAFQKDGYLVLRNTIEKSETKSLQKIIESEVQHTPYPPSLNYPEPAKYTVGGNRMSVPGLASIAEHPKVISAVECLLNQEVYLTAFVAYLRTPGDTGGSAHCDYKRWRPVGSSMNWVFAIIPLTDFNLDYGPLLVSPGSHKMLEVIDHDATILDLKHDPIQKIPEFINPELVAGDLLLMDGRTWHKAPSGTTTDNRSGIFNKYCTVDSPPAAGYYPYNKSSWEALSDSGKRLLPVCFDTSLVSTQLLFESTKETESKFLVLKSSDDKLSLPGGIGWEEEGVGWDIGSRIGSLQLLVKNQTGFDLPWASYIEDIKTETGISRIYGYVDKEFEPPHIPEALWLSQDQLSNSISVNHDISQLIKTWNNKDIVRGKGKAFHQRKHQFD